jgi:hypothetical protein
MDTEENTSDAVKNILDASHYLSAATESLARVVVHRCPGTEYLACDDAEELVKLLAPLIRVRDMLAIIAADMTDSIEHVERGEKEKDS